MNNKNTDYFITRCMIYMKMKRLNEAIKDISYVLSLDSDVKVAYEHRASCYRQLAESEQNPAKKAGLIIKAEEDEKMANELNEKNTE